MTTEQFYALLPPLKRFADLTDFKRFVPVPHDWYILVTDVVNSTQAIAAGHYKAVNLMGAACITAVFNTVDRVELPFVFGGDGMSMLVPSSALEPARTALLATRTLAKRVFNLDLRVGVVPVSHVETTTTTLQVAKVQLAPSYHQACFAGGGITYATDLVKQPGEDNPYRLDAYTEAPSDFSGLECRWQDISSPTGQTISLIVSSLPSSPKSSSHIYRDFLIALFNIYGSDECLRPVRPNALRLSFNPKKLLYETRLRVLEGRSPQKQSPSAPAAKQLWQQALYLSRVYLENMLGAGLMNARLTVDTLDWGNYKASVSAATDYQKFDDALRMVITSTPAQTRQLTDYLDGRFRSGELVYGAHISDRALLTCMVFERNGRHVHFVDAADGGYTQAALALKEKLQYKAQNWKSYTQIAQSTSARKRASGKLSSLRGPDT
ncbi:DUF3095 domain-containing protein [Thermoleptolyngbya sichuanensis XZ-Cy5]|uniref:DUF3095 domain-containing protein n=1 Tax=Thermoleptolyngbya sichuanensis TaxID=2885951 RepID=UPI00240E99D9|nr:DUF3095 domain-containing protein [Thermoleptolyngbya sichuanensis]MDG2616913.1 DUF3095 domain-containing protein [Thermoleptolyngbya sichuanensis XZ-Cy5]